MSNNNNENIENVEALSNLSIQGVNHLPIVAATAAASAVAACFSTSPNQWTVTPATTAAVAAAAAAAVAVMTPLIPESNDVPERTETHTFLSRTPSSNEAWYTSALHQLFLSALPPKAQTESSTEARILWYFFPSAFEEAPFCARAARPITLLRPQLDWVALPDLPWIHSMWSSASQHLGLQIEQAIWYPLHWIRTDNGNKRSIDEVTCHQAVVSGLRDALARDYPTMNPEERLQNVLLLPMKSNVALRETCLSAGVTCLWPSIERLMPGSKSVLHPRPRADRPHTLQELQNLRSGLEQYLHNHMAKPEPEVRLSDPSPGYSGHICSLCQSDEYQEILQWCQSVVVPAGFSCHNPQELWDGFRMLQDLGITRVLLKPSWTCAGSGIIFDAAPRDLADVCVQWVHATEANPAATNTMVYLLEELVTPIDIDPRNGKPISPVVHFFGTSLFGPVADQTIGVHGTFEGNAIPSALPQNVRDRVAGAAVAAGRCMAFCAHPGNATTSSQQERLLTACWGLDFIMSDTVPVLVDVNTNRFNGGHCPKLFGNMYASGQPLRFWKCHNLPHTVDYGVILSVLKQQGLLFTPKQHNRDQTPCGILPMFCVPGSESIIVAVGVDSVDLDRILYLWNHTVLPILHSYVSEDSNINTKVEVSPVAITIAANDVQSQALSLHVDV